MNSYDGLTADTPFRMLGIKYSYLRMSRCSLLTTIVREPRRFIHVKRAGTTDPIGRKDIPWTSQKCFAGKVYPMLFPPNHHKYDVTTGKPFFKNGRNIIHGTIITKVLTHIFLCPIIKLDWYSLVA